MSVRSFGSAPLPSSSSSSSSSNVGAAAAAAAAAAGASQPAISDQMLPVLIHPAQLVFYLNNPTSHKQILTIYNPYSIPLQFSIQATAPKSYVVRPSSGLLRPDSRIDVIIRLADPQGMSLADSQADRFKVNLSSATQGVVVGKHVFNSTIMPVEPVAANGKGNGVELMDTKSTGDLSRRNFSNIFTSHVIQAILFALALFVLGSPVGANFGLNSETSLFLFTFAQQYHYAAAFLLGMLTMAFIQADRR
ncbi:hypothetical protein CAOG_04050 [Capsaspora owczarzaki ATCC 30864]|nr:hypothetical protein CAOG_04050 [Capsaspora owczarzaki ATCC 30864]|eukprot:XP_004347875.1 hypothetical protein CAOG_04050 [Capsaspora owczarzaki ATCC 30864]